MYTTSCENRIKIESRDNILYIIIYAKRNWVAIFFTILALFAWIKIDFILIDAIKEIFKFSNNLLSKYIIFIAFFTVWNIAILLAGLTLLWFFFGKEIIRIKDNVLQYKKSTMNIGINKYFNLEDIENLKLIDSDLNEEELEQKYHFLSNNEETIIFDYKGKSIKFACDLEIADARNLLNLIKKHL